jgi:hypothetical protein
MPPGRLTPAQRRKRMLIVLPLALIAMIVFVVVTNRASSGKDEAAVGDCVKRSTAKTTDSGRRITGDNMKVVACTDAAAGYKVVGKVEHVSRISVSINETLPGGKGVCSPYPSATVRYWRGKEDGNDGYVLCLAPNQH